MTTLESWIDNITVFELFDSAPYGFLSGCGGTSEFLAYMFRTRPSTNEDFIKICRQHEYYDSEINEKSFTHEELENFLDELDKRLNINEYARVSFVLDQVENNTDATNDNISTTILNLIKNPPKPNLFDHSFIITNTGWRFESYINQYEPRKIHWKNYREDLKELFKNPLQKWEEIFEVKCESNYDMSKFRIIINN
jgi:hypothetical protein